MPTTNLPIDSPHVACDVCHKEVPLSEAIVREATDYVAHYCGADCYDRWKRRSEEFMEPGKTAPGPAPGS